MFGASLIFLYSTHAHAQASGEITGGPALVAVLDVIQRRVGTQVLVAAAGPEAERFVLGAVEAMPPGQVRVVRVGILGDVSSEVTRALGGADLKCAVRVGRAQERGRWTLDELGDCSPKGSPAVVDAPAAPLMESHRGPPDPAVVESAWRLTSLSRVGVVDHGVHTWAVRDGRGHTVNAPDFAKRTGDIGTLHRIEREGSHARVLTWGLVLGGGAMALTSLAMLAGSSSGAPDRSEYEVSPSDFRTERAYVRAQEEADADYDGAQVHWEIKRDDRLWVAGFLAASGVITMSAAPFSGNGVDARRRDPSAFWTVSEADALILAWNEQSRARLGLVPSPGAVPPADAAPDDDLEDVPDEPPASSPLELTPIVSPGFLGLSGRF